MLLLTACPAEEPPEAPPPYEFIRYPGDGSVTHHDFIPIWIRAPKGELFDRMTVRLNGDEITASFLPWGARLPSGARERQDPESLAVVRPGPGPNRIELSIAGEEGVVAEQVVDFRFEPPPMRVRIRVLEGDREIPARLSFLGIGGTKDPTFAPEIWQEIAPQREEHLRNFLYAEGSVEIHLPSGQYEVLASRGPAYSMARAEIGPERADVSLEIERVVETAGWISADFHVHAIPSGDSSIPLWDRVMSFWAQDVDVIVASDHHTITDYRADLAPARSLPPGFNAIPGTESGLKQMGHWNFWPLARDESSTEPTPGGARSYGAFRPPTITHASDLYRHYEALNARARRERFGDFPVVIQMNHPRGFQLAPFGEQLNYFAILSKLAYDPEQPLSTEGNGRLLSRPSADHPRPIDVDAIELLNRLGYSLYVRVRTDWFAWLAQGFAPTATANTDSHWLVVTEAGFPRNWVRFDGPLPIGAEDLARAVRSRQVVGSTGPLVTLEPWDEDGRPIRGPVPKLTLTVRAPAWMPVEEARVYVNGELLHTAKLSEAPMDPYAATEQLHRVEVPLSLEGDSFVVAEVGDRIERLLSAKPHAGPIGRAFPGLRVLAFTNALLVDPEGDGSPWDSPQRRSRAAAPPSP